jgi:ABC-type polysaccharide/polyol phosphate export permease
MRLPLLGQYPSEANWTFSIVSALVFLSIAAVIFKKFEHRIAYWV